MCFESQKWDLDKQCKTQIRCNHNATDQGLHRLHYQRNSVKEIYKKNDNKANSENLSPSPYKNPPKVPTMYTV